MFESRGFDFTFSHFSDGMSDNFSSGTSVEENLKDKKTEMCKYVPFSQRGYINNSFFTSKAISLKINTLQCGYFSKLIREDGELVISQVDAGQMLHFRHRIGQFGEHISLQVQFCKVFQDTSKSKGHLAVFPIRARRHSVNVCEVNSM